MTLLEDLIDSASSDTAPVSTLLRKVKVIAARLRTGELEEWVEHELVGYPDHAALPEYRGPFPASAKGHFIGPFQAQLQYAPIAPIGFPTDWREGALFTVVFHQPIIELERLGAHDEVIQAAWPADAVALTNTLIGRGEVRTYPDMYLQQAWREISPAQIRAIVDTVRSRILDLSLKLERIAPNAGQPNADPPNQQEVKQIVTNVFGGSTNIAIHSSDFEQTITVPPPGDVDALIDYLNDVGRAPTNVDGLT